MEKLQAALEKARRNRGTAPVPARRVSGGPASQPTALDDLWASIPTFEVADDRLEALRVVSAKANSKATHFDVLRTKILLQMRQNGWKRLAITSPMPRSGKTTTACNLALGLGRQEDLRTMLFDFDLRSPSVHEFFGTMPKHNLSEVLSGRVAFSDHVMRAGRNVAVSMEPVPQEDPASLLLAEETAEILDDIQARYKPDMMIFDLPSILVNDDTRAFLKKADCALIVIWANSTRYNQFDTCEREVSELTNVLGVVLNAYRL